MTTSNLSIVDSLIRSHFGSNLWTQITDINFFNDDRIKQINQCFKDLPVKSKLYILMALGNLNNNQFLKWKNQVESIFLRAMVEGNLLVRAIATILQQKFGLNYLTFDISLSLENFADILIKLQSNLDKWDVSCECIVAEYISENVVREMMRNIENSKSNNRQKTRKRKLEIEEKSVSINEAKSIEVSDKIGCKLKYLPKSYQIKQQYLQKIELECNKKRISVPIPGRNKIKLKENENEIDEEKDINSKIMKETAQIRKDNEINARLEDIKKRLQQKKSSTDSGRKESKVICLSLDELPPTGPKAKQMIREKEKEARKVEKEDKLRRVKEEKEADKMRKQQEKENRRVAQQMMVMQQQQEAQQAHEQQQAKAKERQQQLEQMDMQYNNEGGVQSIDNNEDNTDNYLSIPVNYHQQQQSVPQFINQLPPQIRLIQSSDQQPTSVGGSYQIIDKPIRFITNQNASSQSVFRSPHPPSQQQSQPQIVLIQSAPSQLQNNNNFSSSSSSLPIATAASNQIISQQQQQPSYIQLSTNQTGGVKLLRLVSTSNNSNNNIPQQQQQRLVRIIGSSPGTATSQQAINKNPTIISAGGSNSSISPAINITRNYAQSQITTVNNVSQPPPLQQQPSQPQQHINQQLPVAAAGATHISNLSQQQQIHVVNPQSMQLETMKILIRYANRLSRPQKAMIVSYIAGSADGVDFNGQSSVHISSHRAINLDTFQPLNVIVDAFFLMDYRTGRWSIVKQYREPRNEEDICSFDLQPSGYPPEFSMQA